MSLEFEGERSVVTMIRDVTERRRIETQLAQAERMASLGALAAGVAHEINNPLTYVLLRLEAIADTSRRLKLGLRSLEDGLAETQGREAARELVSRHFDIEAVAELGDHAATASEGAQRVRRIVGDLRVFSRGQDDTQQVLDVHEPLELAASMASFELKHRASLVKRYGAKKHVSANVNRLAQIFLNLILNAVQSLDDDGETASEVTLTTRDEGDAVVVEVADTGVGIPEEHFSRLFEPFFTTKPVGLGSGLGLAICHGIVRSFGGEIRVESRTGDGVATGSTFAVVLPGTLLPVETAPAPASQQRSWKSGRILVIDDEPHIAESIAIALGRFGQVVTAASGAAARNLLVVDPAFDVILCDVVMPGFTGIDLHRHLSLQAPALAARMLFMTGGRSDEEARAFAESVGDRWLEKPVDIRALEERVIDLLTLSHALGQKER